jgi:hypothetical protein
MRNHLGVAFGVGVAALAGLVLFARSGAPGGQAAADVSVSCGFGQRAIVKQIVSSGAPHVAVDCVQGSMAPAGYADPYGASSPYAPMVAAPVAGMVPAVYTAPVANRALVPAQSPPVRRISTSTARASSVRTRSSTSWQRKALVIGGSTGVGAGVGALVGGKKGALIGAAIGGGSGAVYEAIKRK